MLAVAGDGRIIVYEDLIRPERDVLDSISAYLVRLPYLVAAIDCALILPVGAIRYAMSESPGVRTAFRRNQISVLLSPDDIEEISEEYQLIDSVMEGQYQDLMDPAIVWLSARLSREHKVAQFA